MVIHDEQSQRTRSGIIHAMPSSARSRRCGARIMIAVPSLGTVRRRTVPSIAAILALMFAMP